MRIIYTYFILCHQDRSDVSMSPRYLNTGSGTVCFQYAKSLNREGQALVASATLHPSQFLFNCGDLARNVPTSSAYFDPVGIDRILKGKTIRHVKQQ